jgi:hypothetical protein
VSRVALEGLSVALLWESGSLCRRLERIHVHVVGNQLGELAADWNDIVIVTVVTRVGRHS